MATLEQLRRNVGTKTGMAYSSSGTERDLIDFWLNTGVREVLIRTHCFVKCADLTLSANEWKYDLPTNILALKAIVDTENNLAEIVSLEDVLDLRRTTTSVAVTRMRVAILGSNLLAIWPTPSASVEIDVFYVPMPTEMSTTTDDPASATYGGVPKELHHAIELWALAQASDHEHEGRTQQGVNYLAQFDEYIRRVARPTVNRKGGRMPRARVGRRGTFTTAGNDRYPAI